MKKTILALASLLLLSACTGTVMVPPAGMTNVNALASMPGKYTANIQTGGWHLETKSVAFTCSAWSFDTTVDNAFADTMKASLQTIGNIDFIEAPLTAAELSEKGYDGQIVVYQAGAQSSFAINPGFFTGTAIANMALDTNIAIMDRNGLSNQFAVSGKGTGSSDVFGCGDVGKAIASAGQAAVGDIANQSLLYVREGLHSKPAPLPETKPEPQKSKKK